MTEPVIVDGLAKPHRTWLTYLDGWRGLAVLAVLAAHFFPIPVINTGRLGVEAFFCLSGRLMAGILFLEHYPLGRFISRRVTRVWPALYAFVIIIAVAMWGKGPNQVIAIDVVGALTFTANYTGIYAHRAPPFDHLWSLAVEEWAYLVLALLALCCRRFGWKPVLALSTGAMLCIANGILQSAMGHDYYAVYWRTDVRVASILLPCAVFVYCTGKPISPWIPLAASAAGILLNVNHVPDVVKYSLGTLCLSIAVSTIDVAPIWFRQILSAKWLRMVGLWSFSLYLWQQPFAKSAGLPILNLLLGPRLIQSQNARAVARATPDRKLAASLS